MEYFVKFGDTKEIMNDEELKNFIEVAVIHNKDIKSFKVIAIDSRLTEKESLEIAKSFGLEYEVHEELAKGESPLNALREWDI